MLALEGVDSALSTCQEFVNFTNTSAIRRRRVVLFGTTLIDIAWSRSRVGDAVRVGGGAASRRGA